MCAIFSAVTADWRLARAPLSGAAARPRHPAV